MSLKRDLLFLLVIFSGTLLAQHYPLPSATTDEPVSRHQLNVLERRERVELARFISEEGEMASLESYSLALLSPSQAQILGIDFPNQETRRN